jgi:cytochrome c oxidase assembly factor CtaG
VSCGFISFPAVAWIAFAARDVGAHFSPLFDAALENPLPTT